MGTFMEYAGNDSKTAFFVLVNKYGEQIHCWELREKIFDIALSKAWIQLQIINLQYLEAELFSGHFPTKTLPPHHMQTNTGKNKSPS